MPAYAGAVRAGLLAQHPELNRPSAGVDPSGPAVIEDMSLMAAISDQPGFPGIEYVGG